MTLQQLRYLCEIARQGLHLSRAAATLNTSQPGVSRQIHSLEKELRVTILQRRRNRILGLTAPGKEILRLAQQMLRDAESVRNLSLEVRNDTSGHLVIATNHTHARYTLPRVITAFAKGHPSISLEFWQGNREEPFRWLDAGEVDVALGSITDLSLEKVLLLPCGEYHRIVVTPPRHPLLRVKKPSLEDIARYPIITHALRTKHDRWKFNQAFEARKLKPKIIFSAIDSDISKAYVELGMGIAILPHIAFDQKRDPNLRAIDVGHLFSTEPMHVAINKKQFHRSYLFDFLEILTPELPRRQVERMLAAAQAE